MKIAIVDDIQECSLVLKEHIKRYEKEKNLNCEITIYNSGLEFIESYNADKDIVFLDVKMPLMDGMEVAKKIRAIDNYICIVFVTSYAQYAIKGYEVQAFDYIIKPISYGNFKIKMDKVLSHYKKRQEKCFSLLSDLGMVKLSVSDIYFVGSNRHYLIFHTAKGEFTKRGQLTNVEEELKGCDFSRCNVSFLVNLQHAERVHGSSVSVAGIELPISRNRKIEFLSDLTVYLGGGIL